MYNLLQTNVESQTVMDDAIKHRLVGTVVLLICAAILLPMMFSESATSIHKQQRWSARRMNAPKVIEFNPREVARAKPAKIQKVHEEFHPPSVAHVNLDKPKKITHKAKIAVVKKPNAVTVKHKVAQRKVVQRKVAQPKLVRHKAKPQVKKVALKRRRTRKLAMPLEAWVIQLGSFTNHQHAQSLEKRLRRQGFAAFTRRSQNRDGIRFTRVLVGPETRRDRADKLAARISKRLQSKAIVVHYKPTAKRRA